MLQSLKVAYLRSQTVPKDVDSRVNPLTDLVIAWFIAKHGVVEQIEGDHVVEESGGLMRIAPSQTPRSLLFLDEPSNDAPGSLWPALEPGAPERRKSRRFGDDKPLKRQVPVLKQDADEGQSERSQAFLDAKGGDVGRNE
jgi:hypothetical protein